MANAGYSGTPLPKKLGLKDGQKVAFVGLPTELEALTEACAFASVKRVAALSKFKPVQRQYDVIHAFTKSHAELKAALPLMQDAIVVAGMIWVSWPKKASKVATDVTEDVIRTEALAIGLVDIKVCAVDAVWSGLKLVIRKENR